MKYANAKQKNTLNACLPIRGISKACLFESQKSAIVALIVIGNMCSIPRQADIC